MQHTESSTVLQTTLHISLALSIRKEPIPSFTLLWYSVDLSHEVHKGESKTIFHITIIYVQPGTHTPIDQLVMYIKRTFSEFYVINPVF